MKKIIKKITRKLISLNKKIHNKLVYKQWIKDGMYVPPPHQVKQQIISNYQKETGYKTLIETGTFYGHMIDAQLSNFKKIISVELSQELYSKAIEKYKKNKKVSLYNGDSGKLLKEIMKSINESCIFFLDGHYSHENTAKGDLECPILEELLAIFNGIKLPHLILIDDARLFIGENDYPTIVELKNYIYSINPNASFEIYADIIKVRIN